MYMFKTLINPVMPFVDFVVSTDWMVCSVYSCHPECLFWILSGSFSNALCACLGAAACLGRAPLVALSLLPEVLPRRDLRSQTDHSSALCRPLSAVWLNGRLRMEWTLEKMSQDHRQKSCVSHCGYPLKCYHQSPSFQYSALKFFTFAGPASFAKAASGQHDQRSAIWRIHPSLL